MAQSNEASLRLCREAQIIISGDRVEFASNDFAYGRITLYELEKRLEEIISKEKFEC